MKTSGKRPSEKGTKIGTHIANVVLGGAGVCCVIALVYLIYNYSWTQKGEFTNLRGMLLYYGLPALLAGLCFALLRFPPAHRINAALLLVSTGASIYAGETVLNIWFSLPSVRAEMARSARASTAKEFGIKFDTRTKLEFADALREKGIDAYPTGTRQDLLEKQADGTLKSQLSIGTEVLPLGWISNRASVLCNESGDFVVYDSDERGFHNPRGLWNSPRVEIVALGDSYTNGFCVPSDKNFVAMIRKQYPATLNLGMAGHGSLSILATLKEYGALVRPRLVLWFHYEGNDLRDLAVERKSPLLMRYLEDSFTQGLANRQADVDRVLMAYVHEVRQTSRISRKLAELLEVFENPGKLLGRAPHIIKLSHLRRQLGFVYGTGGDYPREDGSRRFKAEVDAFGKSLLEAKEFVSAWGGKLYFVYLPHYRRYTKPAPPEWEWGRNRVLQTVRGLGLPVIDVHQVFKAQEDPLALFPFRQDNHYNETGHRLVAEEVLRSVLIR